MRAPRIATLLALALLCTACGATPPSTETPAALVATNADSLETMTLAEHNQHARNGAVRDTLHGVVVDDPFRALEEDNAATWAWVEAQNAATEAYMAEAADEERAERLAELFQIGSIGSVQQADGRVFYQLREGDLEQPILYVVDAEGAAPRVLIDPNTLGERVSLDYIFPSHDGALLAYGLSENGDERSTLHVLDVTTREDVGVAIAHAKWTDLTWRHDGEGFYYTRYPRPGEADYDADNEDSYHRHLFYHALGSDPADDPLVMRAPEATDFLGATLSRDDATLLISVFRGWSSSQLLLLDLGDPDASPADVGTPADAITYGMFHGDAFYAYTNDGAPKGRLLRANRDALAEYSAWEEVVAEREGTLEAFDAAGDQLVLHYVENVSSVLRLADLDGSNPREVPLPVSVGSVRSIATDGERSRVLFGFDSYFQPPALFSFEAESNATPEAQEVMRVQSAIDIDAYTVTRALVPSSDGTPINVFLVHARDMPMDGDQPVLLNGYGGFNVSLTPGFARNTIYWLEQGGVYAVANIRGGGEFGEAWHEDGMLGNKQNVFDDFASVIRWLGGESRISRPERIAITGGSNGGLLMGAMLTQCPDAFGATVTSVGLYDMVRYTEFPPAEIWIPEYGDPAVAEAFSWLHAYSPYHNVPEDTSFPASLVLTADSDTRVSWQHSTKFTALLQSRQQGERPILFYLQRGQGHGAGSGFSDLVDEYVQRYSFIERELGVD